MDNNNNKTAKGKSKTRVGRPTKEDKNVTVSVSLPREMFRKLDTIVSIMPNGVASRSAFIEGVLEVTFNDKSIILALEMIEKMKQKASPAELKTFTEQLRVAALESAAGTQKNISNLEKTIVGDPKGLPE